jgi:hypothetical protein
MLKRDQRTCDMCGAVILKEQIYDRSTIPPEKATLAKGLLEGRSFIEGSDGSITLDLCLGCNLPARLIASE